MPMLSRNLERAVRRALSIAATRQHEYATLEHLLYALTEDQDAVAVLRACAVELEQLRATLMDFLDRDLSGLVVDAPTEPKPTASFTRVMSRAAISVQAVGRQEVTGADVLVAMFSERESHAVHYLRLQDMTRLDAVNFISRGITKHDGTAESRSRLPAADQSNADAQFNLGRMYETGGGGLAKDEAQAAAWYREAADQGHAAAQNSLGVMYRDGRGGLAEAQAVELFRKAADQGNADAQFNLGRMYETGRGGLAKDEAQAAAWYREAADQGHAAAQNSLGVMYRDGRGVAQDDAQAVELFRKAAHQGNEDAKTALKQLGQ